jgi:hypothetical protein
MKYIAGTSAAPLHNASYFLSSFHLAAVFMAMEAAICWAQNIIKAMEGSDATAALSEHLVPKSDD